MTNGQHCGHECVCHWHVEGKTPIGENGLCKQEGCHFDTRTTPALTLTQPEPRGQSIRELREEREVKLLWHKANQITQQPDALAEDTLLNNLLASFMVANQKGNFRPWNIQHIQEHIEKFRGEQAAIRGKRRE